MSNKYPGGIITSGANAGYSVAFDGSGDSLTAPQSNSFRFSGNFTIEAWVYANSSAGGSNYDGVFDTRSGNVVSSASAGINYTPSGYLNAYVAGSNLTSSTLLGANRWVHVALVRSGSAVTLYQNGISVATGTTSANLTDGYCTVGGFVANGYWNGYISNVRVVNGTAVYSGSSTTTANFALPTQLFPITNTSFLTCQSPAIVDNSVNAATITANGNAAVSTFTPFTGTQLVPNPNTLANTQGVWSISDAAYWMSQNKWPMPPNYPLQSLRFNSADTTYLNRTPSVNGDLRTWTWSGWIKRTGLGFAHLFNAGVWTGSAPNLQNALSFNSSDNIQYGLFNGSTNTQLLQTSAVYRDVGAWMHIVIAVDTTQATASNRLKLYVNGVQVTAFASSTYPAQNDTCYINSSTYQHRIGRGYDGDGANGYFNGYMTEVYFVNAQQLTPSSFGANDPNTGVWSPVPYSGTYGTNGFRLSFQDNTGTTATTLGRDYSGNGNNWTPNNFSVAAGSGNDSLTDGPTNWGIDYGNGGEVRGNYATLNPLVAAGGTFTNGNLDFTAADNGLLTPTTVFPSSGKWYCEIVWNSGVNPRIGVTNTAGVGNNLGSTANSWAYLYDGRLFNNNAVGNNTGVSATTGDIIMLALDIDAGKLWYGKNGVWMPQTTGGSNGSPATGANATQSFTANQTMSFAVSSGGGTPAWTANFGQRPFAYPAPSGFKVLCTTNLPIPTVGATSTTLANKYFDATLYTGNNTTNAITNAGGFQPDLVWAKNRTNAYFHGLYDVIRGTGITKSLYSNSTASEGTNSANQNLVSFDSSGFTLGATSSTNAINDNGTAHVAWQWKAGGTGVSNTAGSITSTVSASTTAGFSIVTYTGNGTNGATVGHGLGKAVQFIIVKQRGTGGGGDGNWLVGATAGIGWTGRLILNGTFANEVNSTHWNNTAPTSSVFTLGTSGNVNGNTGNYVAYCFAEIAGFSRFGSYTGNGNADGPFVYCGFRPRYILVKRTDAAETWNIFDTARAPYNIVQPRLQANAADAEDSAYSWLDILSNGFKLRGNLASSNNSGGTYIFMAFAEAPFNYSRAR